MMLMARAMLGAVAAAAGPIAASLVGDVVAPDERGHVFGRLLLAQLIGTTVGVTVSGEIGGLIGWRWAYWWLAAVGLVIVALLGKATEPRRRSSSDDSSARMPIWRAAGRVLRIKTNLVLIVASAFGYYFFAGVATFGLSYLRSAFGIRQVAAPAILVLLGLAGASGVLMGGRVADRLVRKKVRAGRVWAVLGAFGGAVVFLVTALVASTLWVTLPLLIIGAALLGAANPPLDAARIDIVPRPLLGRAEAIRSVLRSGADASAPITFGLLAGSLGIGHTFLLMTAPLAVAFGLGAIALHTYPADVAAAESASKPKRASPRANHSADADTSLRSAS
jgi:predicted MFS family arabinose efflux permease